VTFTVSCPSSGIEVPEKRLPTFGWVQPNTPSDPVAVATTPPFADLSVRL
jgi:hypothetical protein